MEIMKGAPSQCSIGVILSKEEDSMITADIKKYDTRVRGFDYMLLGNTEELATLSAFLVVSKSYSLKEEWLPLHSCDYILVKVED